MLNHSSVINEPTWGAHLNFEGPFTSPPICPNWITPLQQLDWHHQRMVMWDANLRVVTHLYAGHALDVLEHMRVNNVWKESVLVIGSPTFRLPISKTTEQSNPKVEGIWTLENQIALSPDQAQNLFEFLITQEKALVRISTRDKANAQKSLKNVYRLIATYGRKIRESKRGRLMMEPSQKRISSTLIPRGNYFTVPQAAEICNVTSKQIRAWIRKRKLEAFELPGLGFIIEVGKLGKFIDQKVLDPHKN